MMTKRPSRRLPETIHPMLAKLGGAFDSPDFLFEIKWDGTRALCYGEGEGFRLQNRRQVPMNERYPELEGLAQLPRGCVIDGEIVVLRSGRPDFARLLQREQAVNAGRIKALARTIPVTYVVFDLLYERFTSLMRLPLAQRREKLHRKVQALGDAHIVMSQGIVGDGRAYFEQAAAQELEGIIAKRLSSPYLPGQRTDHWIKIKRRQQVPCAIVGYVPDPVRGLKSLIIAADFDGGLRCVGKVGSGIGERMSRRLLEAMRQRHREKPIIACKIAEREIRWLEPGLLCQVSFLERTEDGNLRAPVFERLIEAPAS